jgi:hypothetical protein
MLETQPGREDGMEPETEVQELQLVWTCPRRDHRLALSRTKEMGLAEQPSRAPGPGRCWPLLGIEVSPARLSRTASGSKAAPAGATGVYLSASSTLEGPEYETWVRCRKLANSAF